MKFSSRKSSVKNIDSPHTTVQRINIINNKYFLKNIYHEFYKRLFMLLSPENRNGKIVELGSGAGFIKKIIPNTITSDILKLPNVDMHFSALKIPFKKNSINAFVMIDVFHHIHNADIFLKEAERCLKKNGQIIMIEPANSIFGGLIYKYFHHEPYNPHGDWTFPTSGPLSGANSTLPWIVFFRDRKKFEKKYPNLKIAFIETHTPLKYLLSGGFSFRQLLPDFSYPVISSIEQLLLPLNAYLGIFYTISITKKDKS